MGGEKRGLLVWARESGLKEGLESLEQEIAVQSSIIFVICLLAGSASQYRSVLKLRKYRLGGGDFDGCLLYITMDGQICLILQSRRGTG